MNRVWLGFSDKWGVEKLTGESLVGWSEDGSRIIPCVVTDAQISNEGRVYTYHIHKGIKWSDGHPFTTEDICKTKPPARQEIEPAHFTTCHFSKELELKGVEQYGG